MVFGTRPPLLAERICAANATAADNAGSGLIRVMCDKDESGHAALRAKFRAVISGFGSL